MAYNALDSNNLTLAQGLTNNGQSGVTLYLNLTANTLNIVDDNNNDVQIASSVTLAGTNTFGIITQTGLTSSFAASGVTFTNLPAFYPAQYQMFLSGGVVYVATKA